MEQRHDTDMAVTRSRSVRVSCQTDTQEMNCLTTLVGFGAIFKRGELQNGVGGGGEERARGTLMPVSKHQLGLGKREMRRNRDRHSTRARDVQVEKLCPGGPMDSLQGYVFSCWSVNATVWV